MSLDWAHAWLVAVILAAACAGGAINVIAGGGSLITFPTLLLIGLNPILANATNTVSMWPASASGAYGFRRDIRDVRRSLLFLLIPSIAGGALGALLLTRTPPRIFESIAPFLVLAASLLFAFQGRIARGAGHDLKAAISVRWWVVAAVGQFLVAIYGGFFGAGIGILMLATLGLIGMKDIHQVNGLKNVLAVGMQGAALVYFVASGTALPILVPVMVAGSIVGGMAGATLAHRVGRRATRGTIVLIGIVMSAVLVAKTYL
jgi:Predicted permeases